MTLKPSADIKKRLEAAAQTRGVSEQTLVEQALVMPRVHCTTHS